MNEEQRLINIEKSHQWYLKNKHRAVTWRENRKLKHTVHGPFDLRQTLLEEANKNFERFKAYVKVVETDCWLWQSTKTRNGYAQFRVNGKRWLAHRWIFLRTIGPIPHGLELDHLCRVRNCVNPLHLEPITHSENVKRGNNSLRLFSQLNICRRGHPLEGSNVMLDKKRGSRRCKICFIALQKSMVKIAGGNKH
jgi:hypothetical protein